ncbi:MAG: hypothetical protein H6728_08510 [Myxococcales bacterium]|nr:hypothetical protein [Myxococcales bacterium]
MAGVDPSTIRLQVSGEGALHFQWRKIKRAYQVPEHYRDTTPRIRAILLFAQAFLDSYRTVLPKAPRRSLRNPPSRRTTKPPKRLLARVGSGRKRPPLRKIRRRPKPRVKKVASLVRPKVPRVPPPPRRELPPRRIPASRPAVPRILVSMSKIESVGEPLLLKPVEAVEPSLWWAALDVGGGGLAGVFPSWGVGGGFEVQVGWERWSGFLGADAWGLLGSLKQPGLLIQPRVGGALRLWDGTFSGDLLLFAQFDLYRVQLDNYTQWRSRVGGGLGLRLRLNFSRRWSAFFRLSGALYPNGFEFLEGEKRLMLADYWQAHAVLGVRFWFFGQ